MDTDEGTIHKCTIAIIIISLTLHARCDWSVLRAVFYTVVFAIDYEIKRYLKYLTNLIFLVRNVITDPCFPALILLGP